MMRICFVTRRLRAGKVCLSPRLPVLIASWPSLMAGGREPIGDKRRRRRRDGWMWRLRLQSLSLIYLRHNYTLNFTLVATLQRLHFLSCRVVRRHLFSLRFDESPVLYSFHFQQPSYVRIYLSFLPKASGNAALTHIACGCIEADNSCAASSHTL